MLWAPALGNMCWFTLASEPQISTPSACGSHREGWRSFHVGALLSLRVPSAADRCVMCCCLSFLKHCLPCRPGMLWASALGTICVRLLSRVRASYKHAVCLWLSLCGLTQLISAASYAVAFRRQSIAVPGRPGMLWASALGTICVGCSRVRASYKHAVCLWLSSHG